jgi:ABC-type multidrug transport system ATPase subunit
MEHGRLMAMGTPAELARQVGAGLRYAVEVADGDVTLAADLLADVPGLTRLQTNAHHVELSVESREVIPAVLAALVGGEVRVYTVTAQEASLEDIYFRLHDVTNTGDRVQPVQTIAAVQEVK